MEKRVIIAIALSLLILMSWSAWVSKTQPIANKEVAAIKPPSVAKTVPGVAPAVAPTTTPASSDMLKFAQGKFDVFFVESQAAIQEVAFKDYPSATLTLANGFLLNGPTATFRKESFQEHQATFNFKDQDKEIIKRFIFSKDNYDIGLEIQIRNMSNLNLEINWPLIIGVLDFAVEPADSSYKGTAAISQEKNIYPNGHKDATLGNIQFAAMHNRYFCAIVEPADNNSFFVKKLSNQESQVYLQPQQSFLAPGKTVTQKFHIYLGPQDLRIINSVKPNWSIVMHYGTFNFIAHLLLQLLEWTHRLVPNWGWVIIILSIIIYLVLYPLTLKQMRSMKAMQTLQPRIEELRKSYKDNPQRLNKEIMELYKEHKVNPFGGCLPLILQIPVFFALYQVLMRSVALKGAKFLWIKDLSQPDQLFLLPNSLPILGNEINILPIIMAIGMFFQQKLSMSNATTGTSAEQQKMMLILFPIMFGFIFYKMPSGLVLYWLVNSSLMLAYQWRISRQK